MCTHNLLGHMGSYCSRVGPSSNATGVLIKMRGGGGGGGALRRLVTCGGGKRIVGVIKGREAEMRELTNSARSQLAAWSSKCRRARSVIRSIGSVHL